jgi:hypothetical protein
VELRGNQIIQTEKGKEFIGYIKDKLDADLRKNGINPDKLDKKIRKHITKEMKKHG